ncbi:MAG TPA: beta-propeller domain-containing protein [Candidatus Binatia bacterium]|nr:beta-propeller domain-containing protein [Candidatus Binatia bacterium]
MHRFLITAISAGLIGLVLAGCGSASGNSSPPKNASSGTATTKKTMRPFRSDAELASYLRQAAEKQRRKRRWLSALASSASISDSLSNAPAAAAGAVAGESVTNVQHEGVDEGGIVKVHGDHLVILRRGRLFTVAIGDGTLTPVSSTDAFGPDIDPQRTWYDELLVSGETVAVIGYSYERGGTEVGLFRIDPAGRLAYRSIYQLRSNDYYSSRNYASRLIGDRLIFYAPLYYLDYADLSQSFPAVRKWHKGTTSSEFRPIASAAQIYRPERPVESAEAPALHTVTVCDLAGAAWIARRPR